jgi:hypothetical protein
LSGNDAVLRGEDANDAALVMRETDALIITFRFPAFGLGLSIGRSPAGVFFAFSGLVPRAKS